MAKLIKKSEIKQYLEHEDKKTNKVFKFKDIQGRTKPKNYKKYLERKRLRKQGIT